MANISVLLLTAPHANQPYPSELFAGLNWLRRSLGQLREGKLRVGAVKFSPSLMVRFCVPRSFPLMVWPDIIYTTGDAMLRICSWTCSAVFQKSRKPPNVFSHGGRSPTLNSMPLYLARAMFGTGPSLSGTRNSIGDGSTLILHGSCVLMLFLSNSSFSMYKVGLSCSMGKSYLISGSGHVQWRSWEAQEHPPKILEQKVLEMFWPL